MQKWRDANNPDKQHIAQLLERVQFLEDQLASKCFSDQWFP